MNAPSPHLDPRMLGVLGGMGPMAGAAFMARLTALTPAARDQDHLPAVLWSDPRVPDRTAARLHGGPDPLPWLVQGVKALERIGAGAIVIPCNTAHLWYDEIVAATKLPVLHIIESVIDDLDRMGLAGATIGLMGTVATLKLGLYQRHLEARGYRWVLPAAEDIDACCTAAIEAVKSNCVADGYVPAAEGVRKLRAAGAAAVVLGCTELPLALPHERRAELGIPLTDSIDALALAAIHWATRRPERA